MRRDPASHLARSLAFEDALWDRVAQEKEDFRWGQALLTPAIPRIWDANFLRVETFDDDLDAQGLISEADRVMRPRGLSHRKVVVSDAEVGERIAPALEEEGWVVTTLLYMVHEGDPPPSEIPVDEVVEAVHIGAKDGFNRRNPLLTDEDVLAQMRELHRRISAATDKRCFAAYAGDSIASVCELYSDGITAQIEDVQTLEEHRNRGLAGAVVTRALQEARRWGHETIFLVVDDDSRAKDLYGKLGFEPAGRTFGFLLMPG